MQQINIKNNDLQNTIQIYKDTVLNIEFAICKLLYNFDIIAQYKNLIKLYDLQRKIFRFSH